MRAKYWILISKPLFHVLQPKIRQSIEDLLIFNPAKVHRLKKTSVVRLLHLRLLLQHSDPLVEESFDVLCIVRPLLAVVPACLKEHSSVFAVHLSYGQPVPGAERLFWNLHKLLNLLEFLKVVGELQHFLVRPDEIEEVKSLQIFMETLQLRGYLLFQEIHILDFRQ